MKELELELFERLLKARNQFCWSVNYYDKQAYVSAQAKEMIESFDEMYYLLLGIRTSSNYKKRLKAKAAKDALVKDNELLNDLFMRTI